MSIHITFTTIDSRIGNVWQVIKSLLRNKLPDNFSQKINITLFISSTPFLADKGISAIPEPLLAIVGKKYDQFKFCIKTVPNLGPHRKYIFNNLSASS